MFDGSCLELREKRVAKSFRFLVPKIEMPNPKVHTAGDFLGARIFYYVDR